MSAYRVTKLSVNEGQPWALISDDKNYPAMIQPFATDVDAFKFAIANEIPVYETWD